MTFDLNESGTRLATLGSSLLAGYQDEDLHQLRVTLRRMRSVLRNVQDEDARTLRHALGTLAKSTNSARDWDTLVHSAPDHLKPKQLKTLLPVLHARREKARAKVHRMLRSDLWLATIRRWESHANKADFENHYLAVAPGELENRLQRATAAGRRAVKRDRAKSWHKLRILIKELRYTLESRPGAPLEPMAADLQSLCKAMQTQLGEWHDTVVHRQLLAGLAKTNVIEGDTRAKKVARQFRHSLALKGRLSLEEVKRNISLLERLNSCSIHKTDNPAD